VIVMPAKSREESTEPPRTLKLNIKRRKAKDSDGAGPRKKSTTGGGEDDASTGSGTKVRRFI
jgi:hypothetical protein